MVTGDTIIVKKEEPNPRNRQLEGSISLGNKEKLLEEENRKDGEASYNPSLETKEIKKNIKGNSSSALSNILLLSIESIPMADLVTAFLL